MASASLFVARDSFIGAGSQGRVKLSSILFGPYDHLSSAASLPNISELGKVMNQRRLVASQVARIADCTIIVMGYF